MPRVDVVVESAVERSFAVEQVCGMFEGGLMETSSERFCVALPDIPREKSGTNADCKTGG